MQKQPTNLGVHEGRLAACPATPNCVSSQAADVAQRVAPIAFEGPAAAAFRRLRSVVAGLPQATIVTTRTGWCESSHVRR